MKYYISWRLKLPLHVAGGANYNCRMKLNLLIALVFLFLPVVAGALEITGLQTEASEYGEHVSLSLSGRTEYDVFLADAPPARLMVDLPSVHWRGRIGLPGGYQGIINAVHSGRHGNGSRLVFDVPEGTEFTHVKLVHKEHAYALEFDLIRQESHISLHREKSSVSEKQGRHAKRVDGKPLIVIDGGHGGQDNGTSGFSGSHEKDLTLHMAEVLKGALQKNGRYRVMLTRTDDTYLLLGERVKRAREAKGNLFISIHADSSPVASAHGLSVYTISEKASDKQSAALAEKENKADIIGGMDLSDTSKDVADILIDLTQRETRAKSCKFAELLVKHFRHDVSLLNHTHRSAGFAVLKAPDIPSVLIEVGFLSNPREEKLLKSASYQEKFLHGVASAVDGYFGK